MRTFFTWLILASSIPLYAQDFDEKYAHWPEDHRIKGRIVVNNGLENVDQISGLLQRAMKGANIVNLRLDKTPSSEEASPSQWLETLESLAGEDANVTEIRSSQIAPALLKSAINAAQCLLIDSNIDYATLKQIKPELNALLDRSGTLIVNLQTAKLLGKRSFSQNEDGSEAETAAGLNLLPDCVLADSQRDEKELIDALKAHRPAVGITLEDRSAMVLSGRKLMCFGDGDLTLTLPPGEDKPQRSASISRARSRRQAPETVLADLTQWRREAIDRGLPPFPPAKPRTPQVNRGTLLIVGGGGTPRGLTDRFIELAGGKDKARLIYVPCSENDEVPSATSTTRAWQRMGVKHVAVLHTKDRRKANSDEAFFAPLKQATGIFFGGGRQWNFADSYYGTQTHRLMKEVLARGGVIAGSSAGASIQARYLARATPIGNYRIMAPGYERGGLGFIGGVAIDQHFSQRKRQKDMAELMQTHPQLLGIGIDESTAIEVQQSTAKVSGRGRVFFYDTNKNKASGDPHYVALPAGSSYDLAKRTVIFDATKTEDDQDSTTDKPESKQGNKEPSKTEKP